MSVKDPGAGVEQNDHVPAAPNVSAVKLQSAPNTGDDMHEQLYSEMIPEDLLFALTEVNDLLRAREDGPLAPVKTLKTPKEMRVPLKKGVPDNVWHHKARRIQFRHLTDFPKSDGKSMGTKDISFLYDVAAATKPTPEIPSKFDKSASRMQGSRELKTLKSSPSHLAVPDTIVPDEYHLVKSKAVLGLEYLDEKLTTNVADHEKSLRVFPSLKPTKRFEVIQLIKTMDQMLSQVGVDDVENEAKGPTQIHNLLEIMKKEQQIYDVVFHEVIRQVSIECIERGQLLSKLRQRYADLLNRIPRQIKSLHAEVMAQRSLDRRLTEELLRFKTSIGNLTNELVAVKEHDKHITLQAEKAQVDLAEALKESQGNANLVDEYHDLYELQRHRLEAQTNQLTAERDLWCNAAYSLSVKIIAENSLRTAKRLHVTEKAWHKLAGHFTVVIGDQDTESLVQLQQHVQNWRDLIFHFNQVLEAADKDTTNVLTLVQEGMQHWIMTFEDTLIQINDETELRTLKLPPRDMIESLHDDVASWEDQINENCERFGGDTLLSNQEQLIKMEMEVNKWTDIAIAVYDRHRSETGESYPLRSVMSGNNAILQDLTKQLQVRIAGENGVAKDMITLQNNLDSWNTKFLVSLRGAEAMSDTEWLRFYDVLLEYVSLLTGTLENVGSQQKDEDKDKPNMVFERIFVEDTMKSVQDWLKNTVNGIDGENGKMVAQVVTAHNRMVHWMVQMLLHLAPDKFGKVPSESSLSANCSLEELLDKCRDLSDLISRHTAYVCQCTNSIVQTTMQRKKDAGEEDFDHEYRDFMRVKGECKEWIRTCQLLLNTLLDEPIKLLDDTVLGRLDDGKVGEKKVPARKTSRMRQEKSKPERVSKAKETAASTKGESELKDEKVENKEKPKTSETSVKATSEVEKEVPLIEEETKEPPKVESSKDIPKDVKSETKVESKEEQETEAVVKPVPIMISRSLEVIGDDENVQTARLDDDQPGISVSQTSASDLLSPPSSALTQTAYDAIAKMDELQTQLLNTEERAQEAEYKSLQLEESLNAAKEKIRSLEKEITNKQKRDVKDEVGAIKQDDTEQKAKSPEKVEPTSPKPGTAEGGKRSSSRAGQEKKKNKSKKK